MKTSLLLTTLFISLMSFTISHPVTDVQTDPVRKKKIDITITSTNGCFIHIEGVLDFTIVPPAVNGFEGTITISGPKGCPPIVLPIVWEAKAAIHEAARFSFDTNEVCSISKVSWQTEDPVIADILSDKNLSDALVAEFKKTICTDTQ